MAGENLQLSMLLTAQADQAKREIAATAQATRDLARTGPEVAAGMNSASRATEETGRETAGYRAELDQLRAKFNPLFAASKQYEAVLGEIAEAERLGALSATEAAAARDRAATSLMPVQGQMRSLAPVMQTNVAHSANLAAQFNDIGVMALAMQNPLQLALQQGTQINQVFGAMGGHRAAIRSIGPALMSIVSPASLATIAVIALGTAGVQWLMNMRESAMTVEEALAEIDDSLSRLRELDRLNSPAALDEVEARYGRITSEVERLIAARERLALIENRAALDALGEAVAGQAGSRWYDIGISDQASGELALQRNLDISRRDAATLREEIARLGQMTEPADLADQYAQLARMIETVIAELGYTEERGQFLADLVEAEDRARQIVAILEDGNTDTRRGEQMLADLQSELAIQEAINRYGEDSFRVTELRIEAERRAFQEQLRTLDVSDALKSQLLEAWDAVNGIAATDMASGIARARAEASAMADEIARAVGGVQRLMAQSATALDEARIRTNVSDPVEQARQLAMMRMRSAQGILRDGADGLDLAALDAQVRQAGNEAAEVARLNAERDRLNRTRRAGARGAAEERDAVTGLIADLQLELDLLRETDPVQAEMLRHREALAAATAEERAQVEDLIRARNEENEILEANKRALEDMRDLGRDVLRGMISDLREGASAGEILGNVLERVADRLIDMGANSLSDYLFGRSGSNSTGWLGGLIGSFFGGVKANALGDVVASATLFAYGDGTNRLGVMGEAGAEAIMPLTHAMGEGVGAIADGVETTLPLTRLASGKLGVMLPPPAPFALGGTFGPVPTPPIRAAQPLASGGSTPRAEILGRIEIVHSRDFEVRVSGQMQRIAVEVTEQGLIDYDRNLPARMESIGQDPALRG